MLFLDFIEQELIIFKHLPLKIQYNLYFHFYLHPISLKFFELIFLPY